MCSIWLKVKQRHGRYKKTHIEPLCAKWKNTLDGKQLMVENKINKCENLAIEDIQNETQREKRILKRWKRGQWGMG